MAGQLWMWVARYWKHAGIAGALFAFFFAALYVRTDPDFGWHLEAGRYMLLHGIPAQDIFTYTAPNFPWINHEYLSDLIMAYAYDHTGYWLITAFVAALWTAALLLAARSWRWPVLALGFSAVVGYAGVRPNAWSVLFLALTLELIRRHKRWQLIPLFALWANMHGGFVIGLVAVLLVAWKDRRYLWVFAAASVATLLNPYGYHMYDEIWRTLSDSQLRRYVMEWRPLQIEPLVGFYIVIFLVTAIGMGWRKWSYAFPGLLLAASVSSQRQFPLFVISSLSQVAEGYEAFVKFMGIHRGPKRWLLVVAATGLMAAPTYSIIVTAGDGSPSAALADLSARPCSGRIYNEYDFGGDIIWKLPGTKVFIDGRMPSWRDGSKSYMQEWYSVLESKEAAERSFAQYGIDCAILQWRHDRLISQLQNEGWVATFKDSHAIVLRRNLPIEK